MISPACPNCKRILDPFKQGYKCSVCNYYLENVGGILVSSDVMKESQKIYYDSLYETEHGKKWFQGLNRSNILKRIVERVGLGYRRERFFKSKIKGKDNIILDLACGAGRDYLSNFGTVVGVDLAIEPLKIGKSRYQMVVQSGVKQLPFSDDYFDYVISSDFFGHVESDDKDLIQKEIYRVLKSAGKTIHVIETDSENPWFKIAHRSPELFKKYFIDKIGGHIGLEMPSESLKRWEKNGFHIESVEKIWSLIWPVEYYGGLFGEEYLEKSNSLRIFISFTKLISKSKILRVLTDIVLTPVNYLVELVTPLNYGNGIMIVCKK